MEHDKHCSGCGFTAHEDHEDGDDGVSEAMYRAELETNLEEQISALGLAVDYGSSIAGPFIPDGTVRVYDPDTHDVIGAGYSLEDACIQVPGVTW